MPTKPQGRKTQRGAALATTLALLFALSVISAGLMSLVGASMRMSQQRGETTEAFNMADAGVDLALAWLNRRPSPPDAGQCKWDVGSSVFYGGNGTLSDPFNAMPGSTLTVRIDPDTKNASSTQKRYLIESRAVMPGGAAQIVRAYVQQASFGKYAFFCDNDGGGFWDYNNHFEGPFHSNDADGIQTMILWKPNNVANPIFAYSGEDAFSVSGNVTWWKNMTGNTVAPDATSDGGTDYLSIAKGGLPTMTTGYRMDAQGNFLLDALGRKIPNSPLIPLPTTDETQKIAALNGAAIPSTSGVVVNPPNGGIFVHGDNAMQMNVDSNGFQTIAVTQGTTTTTITLNMSTNQTQVKTSAGNKTTNQTFSGLPNGMVFSDGNITALQGTVANNVVDASGNITRRSQMTIATDLANLKNITLSGSVKYATPRDLTKAQDADANFNTRAGTLGILSHTINVSSNASANIEFDASIFATDTFQYPAYNNGVIKGAMTCIGGVIVKNAGLFAQAYSDGSIASGYQEQYHYDNRLADNPPPFFPTTGNIYDVLSWQRVTSLLP